LYSFDLLMQATHQTAFVGVDWGTTHRRAYRLDATGNCRAEFSDDDGALACKGRFPTALETAIQHLQVLPERVVMSGMVGSALGWHEVPYLDEAVALDEISRHLYRVPDAPGQTQCAIVPGYCVRNSRGQPDVMRGEETQLLGAVALGHDSGWFVLPGTHSKWVQLQAGRIVQLRTYMTGELFNLLGQHGTVAAAVGPHPSQWSAAAFAEGVEASGRGALSNLLFSCRARVVCGDMAASSTKSYLSGLLIGSELHDVLRAPHDTASHFKMICSPELATHYQTAALQLQLSAEVLDAKAAFIAAMARIQSEWKPT
jgi:2-dehydro-3-deoxygalactonokinase